MQVKVMVVSKSSMVLVRGHEDASDLLVEMVGYSKALQLMDGPQQQLASVTVLLQHQQQTLDAVLITSSHLHALNY
jgi:hypothetical protein